MFSFYSTLCTELYDYTKPVGYSLNGDIEYYKERLKDCRGRILEAAVGSGRVIIPLLEAGFKVDGIDYSPEMLDSSVSAVKREAYILICMKEACNNFHFRINMTQLSFLLDLFV